MRLTRSSSASLSSVAGWSLPETLSNNLNKPRIPDVCGVLGIRCINLVQFARDQGWTF